MNRKKRDALMSIPLTFTKLCSPQVPDGASALCSMDWNDRAIKLALREAACCHDDAGFTGGGSGEARCEQGCRRSVVDFVVS